MSAALTFLPVSEIKKIVEICRKNNVEITGSVFRKSSVDIEKIISTCRQNNIEITSTVFHKNPLELKRIISVCKKNDIEMTGMIFLYDHDTFKDKLNKLIYKLGLNYVEKIENDLSLLEGLQ